MWEHDNACRLLLMRDAGKDIERKTRESEDAKISHQAARRTADYFKVHAYLECNCVEPKQVLSLPLGEAATCRGALQYFLRYQRVQWMIRQASARRLMKHA